MTAKNLYDFKCEKHNQRLNTKIVESGPPGLKIVYVETCKKCLEEAVGVFTPLPKTFGQIKKRKIKDENKPHY